MKPTIQRRMSRRSLINVGGVALGVYWAAICLFNSQPVEVTAAAVGLQRCATVVRLSAASVSMVARGDSLGAALCGSLILQLEPGIAIMYKEYTAPGQWGITYRHVRGRWSTGPH